MAPAGALSAMRRATRQRLLLIGIVALLVVLAGWQWRYDRASADDTLTALAPAAITRVALALPGQPAERYHRADGRWLDAAGQAADDGRLDELTAIAAAPVDGWRPLSDFEPARIGLDAPAAILQLDDLTLRFGATAATGPLRYVEVDGRVALVSARYTPRPGRRQATPID